MAEAIVVAIVGAESTGKTLLAQALAQRLSREHGLRAAWVPEWLRPWCDEHARTPQREEQAGIAAAQSALIDEAARGHDIVLADTTALMTAVYSHTVFGDDSLDAMAVAAHRRCRLTLLTGLDMPWEPDGLQRDGPHVRPPVDARLRTLLHAHGFAYSVILGRGAQRERAALQVLARELAPLLGAGGADSTFAEAAATRAGAPLLRAATAPTAPSGLPAAGCAPG
ncbi:MAG: hypothetical protein AMXMBFR78_06160 [Rubrivivax sp.]|nr:ATP-binding protein [Rubrivivax sp.]